jgi:hypothetical protein
MISKPLKRLILIVLVLFILSLACSAPTGQQNDNADTSNQNNNSDDNNTADDQFNEPDQPETPTDTSPPPKPPDPTPTFTEPPAPECEPDSEFVTDVNIPDGTLIAPGTSFTKTWTIENDGTCTWNSEYTWDQIDRSGNKLLASVAAMPIPSVVAPGGRLDITVTLTLSATATIGERYDAFFQMRSPDGDLFGTHPYARIYAVVGTGVCPVGPTGQSLFVNTTDQYCFLYPTGYEAYIGATGNSIVHQPPATQGEQILPMVSVSNYGSSGGLNTNQWANSMISSWENPSDPATVSNTQVGGAQAKKAEGIPGITGHIVVFQVHDGDGYVFTIQPVDDGYPAKSDTALDLWEIVRLSFTFYGP